MNCLNASKYAENLSAWQAWDAGARGELGAKKKELNEEKSRLQKLKKSAQADLESLKKDADKERDDTKGVIASLEGVIGLQDKLMVVTELIVNVTDLENRVSALALTVLGCIRDRNEIAEAYKELEKQNEELTSQIAKKQSEFRSMPNSNERNLPPKMKKMHEKKQETALTELQAEIKQGMERQNEIIKMMGDKISSIECVELNVVSACAPENRQPIEQDMLRLQEKIASIITGAYKGATVHVGDSD